MILGLKSTEGNLIHAHGEIEVELKQFFSNLLSETINDRERSIKEINKTILGTLTKEHN